MSMENRLNNLYARYGAGVFLLLFAMCWQPVAAADAFDIQEQIERAKSGDAKAQHALALSYRDGELVEQSDREAVKWLRKAYRKGKNYDAAVDLGDMYLSNRGININFIRNSEAGPHPYLEKALKLYKSAASNGNARAKYRLGFFYMPSGAVHGTVWYKHSSRSKMEYSSPGLHLSKKFPRAEKWLLASAKDGHAEAQYTLGRVYAENDFGADRKRKAIEFYKAAAMQGHFLANYDLGVIYARGQLGTVDRSESYAWFTIAEKLAEKRPESQNVKVMQAALHKSLTMLVNAMEPTELVEGVHLADERMPAVEQRPPVM